MVTIEVYVGEKWGFIEFDLPNIPVSGDQIALRSVSDRSFIPSWIRCDSGTWKEFSQQEGLVITDRLYCGPDADNTQFFAEFWPTPSETPVEEVNNLTSATPTGVVVSSRLLLRIAQDMEKEMSRATDPQVVADLEAQVEGLKALHQELEQLRTLKTILTGGANPAKS